MFANHLTSTVFPLIGIFLINSTPKVLIQSIKHELSASQFVPILLDEITDSIYKFQLSTCLKYVNDTGKL